MSHSRVLRTMNYLPVKVTRNVIKDEWQDSAFVAVVVSQPNAQCVTNFLYLSAKKDGKKKKK